jgi:ubiquinone/menaquinone biosynthesis C-methylase UbiE
VPEPDAQPEPEPEPEPPAEPLGYGDLWVPETEIDAMAAIFNTQDAEAFDASGRHDAEGQIAPLIGRGDVVMDLGCGIGRVARHVAPLCRTLYAVDASERMLEMARERMADRPNVRFARCEGTTLPELGNATIDMAYSLLTLQHVEREDAFLLMRELCRVVRPGGTIYLTFPNLLSETYFSGFVSYADSGEVANPVRARLYTEQEVEWILPAAGLELVEVRPETEIRVTARSGGAVAT